MHARFMAKAATYTDFTNKLHDTDSKRPISQKNAKVIRQISTDMIVFALDRITPSDDSSAPAAAAIPTGRAVSHERSGTRFELNFLSRLKTDAW
jgi:hypothetical protein